MYALALALLLAAVPVLRTPAPTFSPGSESFSSSVSVTVSDARKQAEIYCTTNGATPLRQASMRYTSSLSISSTTTVQCRAWSAQRRRSVVSSATYTLSGSGAAPTLIATDIVAGSTANGEGGKGAYMSLFGWGFGYATGGVTAQAALGSASGAQVWFRCATSQPNGATCTDTTWYQPANYRALIPSRVYSQENVEQIIVQLGSLGSKAAGAVLDVMVSVNGSDSNVLAGQFTVQPGHFWFVSNGTGPSGSGADVAGSDATGMVDSITTQFRYVQNYNYTSSGAFYGIWNTTVPTGAAGLAPGDTIVVRGGTWVDLVGWPNTSSETRWVRFRYPQHNGSAPTGAAGTGYITFTRYPGPIMGQTPETVQYAMPTTSLGGGIQGANGAYATTTGHYVAISGLQGSIYENAASDAAFVNLQSGGDYWRVVDNDIGPWPTGTVQALAGGVVGEGVYDVVQFNKIHDIGGNGTGGLENHGIYAGSGSQSPCACAQNWEVSYNWVTNTTGGNGIQWNDTCGCTSGDGFVGMNVHHNWFEHSAKIGINIATNVQSLNVWDNVILDSGTSNGASVREDCGYQGNSSTVINIVHNTIVQYVEGGYGDLFINEGGSTCAGTTTIAHNIVMMGVGHSSGLGWDGLGGNAGVTVAQNLWYDLAGIVTTKDSNDSTGSYANPELTGAPTGASTCPGGGCNYSLQSSSPARNACTTAEVIAVPTDYWGYARPVPGTGAPGATKNDIGAFQGVGQ